MDLDDYGDDDDYNQNYFYVEDSYDAADDLAEHAVPSPQPWDDDYEWDELSRFEYWADIEYDSDGWNDVENPRAKRQKQASTSTTSLTSLSDTPPSSLETPKTTKGQVGQKRKSILEQPLQNNKRVKFVDEKTDNYVRRVVRREIAMEGQSTVRWRSGEKTTSLNTPLKKSPTKPFALLKDWRQRFADEDGFSHEDGSIAPELTAAVDAAEDGLLLKGGEGGVIKVEVKSGEGKSSQLSERATRHSATSTMSGPDDHMVDQETPLSVAVLDPNVLRAALEDNLAASGAGAGMDPEVLLQYMTRMLEGGEGVDELAGELAKQLLGGTVVGDNEGDDDDNADEGDEMEEDEGDSGAFANWVKGQKGRVGQGVTERKDSSLELEKPGGVEVLELPPSDAEALQNHAYEQLVQPKPVSGHSLEDNDVISVKPAAIQGKKRKNAAVEEEDMPPPKLKKERKGYEMPTTTSKAKAKATPAGVKAGGKGRGKR